MSSLVDRFGRAHTSLRLSVTDRCNLRCHYCMPAEGLACVPRKELLTFEDLVFAVDVAVSLGIEHVRLTGGEPLLRAQLPELVRMIREQVPDLADLSMTSNALLLDRHAQALAQAGLGRINISLDSLRPERFEKITRFGKLEQAWRGIRAAAEAGLRPIKINALALDGFNDDEFDAWIALTKEHDVAVRFMELMPIGEGAVMGAQIGEYLDLTRVRERLRERYGLVPADADGSGPARYWRVPGAIGRIGFITPLSNPYCDTCSRLRLTSTGELRACLAHDAHVHVRDVIRARDRTGLVEAFRRAVDGKPAGHRWGGGQVTVAGMSQLGG